MTTDNVQLVLFIVVIVGTVGVFAYFLGRKSQSKPSLNKSKDLQDEQVSQSEKISAFELAKPSDAFVGVEAGGAEAGQPSISKRSVERQGESGVAPTQGWLTRLSKGLNRTQNQLVKQIEALFTSQAEKSSREAILDGMLEILVRADVGIRTSEMLIEKVRQELPGAEISQPEAVKSVLRREIFQILNSSTEWSLVAEGHRPTVVLMVGVNGVGKTTTTGKLAFKEGLLGRRVIVGAADTFRAAAVDQLEQWAQRAGAECVRLTEGADPASVAFECVKRAIHQNADLCLVDTAGRLHNRQDLMQELAKIKRVASKDIPGAPHEVLLVLDATTGQNALQQAKTFREIAGVTGLVLTKLDGTAKGGVAIALANELKLPIRYIGVGESVDDLQPFLAEEFIDALFEPHKAQIAAKTSPSEATGSARLSSHAD